MKRRKRWFEIEWLPDRAIALAKLCGVKFARGMAWKNAVPPWARTIADFAPSTKKGGNAALVRVARVVAQSDEEQAALDAIYRLGDRRAVRSYLAKLARPAAPRLTPEQIAARKLAKREALIAKRASHARAKLREAERKLATSKRLVARWGAKVRYYEGREIPSDANA
jgi:hypothetical protein